MKKEGFSRRGLTRENLTKDIAGEERGIPQAEIEGLKDGKRLLSGVGHNHT